MREKTPSHFSPNGRARMVDVGGKPVTLREAVAEGQVSISPETASTLERGEVSKGDPLETARIAGIAAAKKTSDLIPLCHPLRLNAIDIDAKLNPEGSAIIVRARVAADERTGVEMEALTACSIALLTVYDMLKAIDNGMVIGPIRLLSKTGGKSDFIAPPAP